MKKNINKSNVQNTTRNAAKTPVMPIINAKIDAYLAKTYTLRQVRKALDAVKPITDVYYENLLNAAKLGTDAFVVHYVDIHMPFVACPMNIKDYASQQTFRLIALAHMLHAISHNTAVKYPTRIVAGLFMQIIVDDINKLDPKLECLWFKYETYFSQYGDLDDLTA